MRSEDNPLDLNNLPEDYTRDGKQVSEDSSSSAGGSRKKKNGAKDDSEKVYECRFCSLKFCKSQALGGHMNRHRQERETETLNRARQLVFTNDLAPGAHHLGYVPSSQHVPHGGFHQAGNIGDPTMPFRSMYTTRFFQGSSPLMASPLPVQQPPPPSQTPPFMYPSPPRLLPFLPQYPPAPPPVNNDYFVGQVLSGGSQYSPSHSNFSQGPLDTNYTCIGAPVGQGFPGAGVRDMSLHNQEEGLNWSRR